MAGEKHRSFIACLFFFILFVHTKAALSISTKLVQPKKKMNRSSRDELNTSRALNYPINSATFYLQRFAKLNSFKISKRSEISPQGRMKIFNIKHKR